MGGFEHIYWFSCGKYGWVKHSIGSVKILVHFIFTVSQATKDKWQPSCYEWSE